MVDGIGKNVIIVDDIKLWLDLLQKCLVDY